MRFDDRLLTVLNLPPGDRHDSAVRWRQLVDLVARAGPNSSSPVVTAALASIRAGADGVDDSLRAAAARAVAALPLPLALLEYFAGDKLSVSAPVLAAATLDQGQWRALAQLADDECRRFIETLHPDLAAQQTGFTETLVEPTRDPPVEQDAEIAAENVAGNAVEALSAAGPSLSEVVARIERRRRHRAWTGALPRGESGVSPGETQSSPLFRWECGPSGEIVWVDGAPRGPLIGRSIARGAANGDAGVDAEAARAFSMRAPFRDSALRMSGDGAVAGEWKISGVPAFEPSDGRFAGYRGIALREAAPAVRSASPSEFLADPDSLRELVHEIKTPLNAIIGFAEIIDAQLLGPADRRYRERAVEIVGQAQLLLAAIDDLDFAGKVHSAKNNLLPRVDLAELVEHGAASLRALAAEHGAGLEIARAQHTCIAAVEPELADRLVARLVTALAEHAASGEALRLSFDRSGDLCRVAIARPAALRGVDDAILFGARAPPASAAPSSVGEAFALRLIRGLARIAGGDLVASPVGLALVFPNG